MTSLPLLTALLALLALVGGVGVLLAGDQSFNARLASRVRPASAASARRAALDQTLRPMLGRWLVRWGEKAGRGAIEADKRIEVRLRLIHAGFMSDRAVEVFFGLRAVAAALGAALGLAATVLLRLHGVVGLVGPAMFGANIGLFLPNWVLKRRIAERVRATQLGLPDAIDLTVVSVEAGATLSAAFQRVVSEFRELHPVLCEQFGTMLMEMQAGASRADALTRMAQRSASEEMGALANMLIQSEAVGASVGGTLRVFAEQLRQARFLEAERRAAELPVKIAFPLVMCILPCLTGVIFVPVLIRILRSFYHAAP